MTAPVNPASPAERLAALEAWFRDANIEYDRKAIALHSTASGAYSVRALTALTEDQPLARIPKDAVLSTKNCGIADLLETAQLDGVTGLAVAVMYERSLGTQSPWFGYLQAIRPFESLPILWSDDDVALLAGTDVEEQTARHQKTLAEDYATRVVPALTAEGLIGTTTTTNDQEQFFSQTAFLHAASLVSSRAFGVDAYHGDAMVPFADLFNHQTPSRSGEGGEHVHMVTDPEVCPHCGSNGACGCDEDEDTGEDDIEEVDEFDDAAEVEEVMEAEDDIGDEDSEMPELYDPADWTIDDPDFDPLDPANFPETDVQDFLEMIVVRDCSAGEEVYNTYGAHGNDYLLSQYGFCEARNAYDTLGVDVDAVIAGASARVGEEQVQQRVEFWNAIGREIVESVLQPEEEDEDDDDDEEEEGDEQSDKMDHDDDGEQAQTEKDNFCFDSTGRASEDLLAFLHLLFTDAPRFASFTENPESFLRHIVTLRSRNWTAASVVLSKAGGARSAKRGGGKAKGAAAAGPPPPQSPVDRAISATLLAVASARGDAYPTTIDEDRARLKKPDATVDGPKRFALLLRIGEKEIIAKAKKTYASISGLTHMYLSAEHALQFSDTQLQHPSAPAGLFELAVTFGMT
ncbi:hypothetical protein HDU86_008167 [Geranomyces michiganensis]|nr:hypothetical protein HDU86_008167 [Geranomyces michiganensis]